MKEKYLHYQQKLLYVRVLLDAEHQICKEFGLKIFQNYLSNLNK